MSVKIVVPDLGESVVEATVGEWLKKEGDAVQAGDPLVSLETDKVDLDVSATQSGVLGKIERQTGEDVQIGDLLVVIEEADGQAAPEQAAEAEAPKAEQNGKGTLPKAKPAAPEEAEAREADVAEAEAQAAEPEGAESAKTERATPVAKRMAAEKGVDIAEIPGAGPGGRVTKADVESYVQERETAKAPAPAPARAPEKREPATPSAAPQPTVAKPASDGREERIRMSRRRRTIAERLVEAQQTAAMLTTFNEVDMKAVMDMRQRRRDEFKTREGVGLGFMSFFVKATIGALKQFPQLNASIEENEIVLKHYYDIGIAVGSEEGLVVPVVRDADRMTFADIERSINGMVEKVQAGTLSLEDLRGGTFTITNGGVFGSLLSTPILNPPQVGILGMHKIEQRPVVVNGEIVIRPMMYLALTYDHRIVDGREAVQFLVALKRLIEDPEELLLAG
ncbi:MAG: 2-oxoglutarate dehydrogenase complex dihydrolipoyllysine-residue succinyltransferase [Caldilineaceae bacterium]|nr:2-oxoglutarate dehydrogenase complex dihydrolipoyllysine-residue succinyltransferase [Caldilineaceae bacterium]